MSKSLKRVRTALHLAALEDVVLGMDVEAAKSMRQAARKRFFARKSVALAQYSTLL